MLWFICVNQLQINWEGGEHECDDHRSDRWIFLKGKKEKKNVLVSHSRHCTSISLCLLHSYSLVRFLALSLSLSLSLNLIYLLFREDTVALPYQPSVAFCQCCPFFTRNSGDGGREGDVDVVCICVCVGQTEKERGQQIV